MGRTLTILFTDLVGSTKLRSALGDDAFDDRRRTHDRALTDAIARRNGELVKLEGDGVMAVFSSASDAVSSAVEMQQRLALVTPRGESPLLMRIGISAGDVAEENGDYHGTPVVEAARLCASADGGQILVAEVIRTLSGSRASHSFEPVGTLELKGLAEPLPTWQVPWSPADRAAALPSRLAEVAARGACVGRDREAQQIRAVWTKVMTGERHLVLIAGEPGIGKTRLAAAVAADVGDEAFLLHGWCDEELGVPYEPWVHAFGAYLRLVDDEHLDAMGSYKLELARLFPDLASRLGGVASAAVDPETDRARLFDAVDALVAEMATGHPLLVVLDDLHWADQPSLALLRWVLRSDRRRSVLFVATYRDTDVDRRHPLGTLLADLRRDGSVSRVALGGLDHEGMTELLADRAGHDVPPDFAQRLHEETDGNPYFAGEVLAHLAETGAIYQRDGTWVSDVAPRDLGLPEGVRDVIGRRLSHLSDAANEVLSVAAVVGREFDVSTVAVAGQMDGRDVLEALEGPADSALVVEVAGAPGTFAFAHALVRQTLLEEMRGPRRARLHWRVGEALAASGIAPQATVAVHLCEGVLAGDAEQAAAAAVDAAEDAARIAATVEARSLALRALEVLDDAALDAPRLRAHALVIIGEATVMDAQEIASARPALVEAGRLAVQHGWPDLAARAATVYGWTAAPGVYDPAQQELARAALALEVSDEWRPVLLSIAARVDILVGDYDKGMALVGEAMNAIDACTPIGRLIVTSAYVQGRFGSPEVATLEEILKSDAGVADEMGSALWQMITRRNAAAMAMRTGRRAEFDHEVAVLTQLEARMTAPGIDLQILKTACALFDGRFDEAEAMAMDMLRSIDTASVDYANTLGQIAAAWYWTGRDDDLLDALGAFETDVIPQQMFIDLVRASTLARRGERHPAFAALAADDFEGLPLNWARPGSLAHAGAAAAWLGDERCARALEPLVAPYAGQVFMLIGGGIPFDVADSVRGMLLATVGRHDEAIACLEAAAELCTRAGAVTHGVMNTHRLASALVARSGPGDRAQALTLATDALRRATELGMAPDVGFAQRVLDALGRP